MKNIPRLYGEDRRIALVRAQEMAQRILEHFAVAMQDWDDCQNKEVEPGVAKELVALAKTCQTQLSRMIRGLTWSAL
jgi:hypothetical protein